MDTQTKKLISGFIFVNGIILCALLAVLGSITAVERTEYNMYRKHYSVIEADSNREFLQLNIDGKEVVSLDFSALSDYEKYADYLSFSYAGNVYYLVKTAKELFFE